MPQDQRIVTLTEQPEVTERVQSPSPFLGDDHWHTLARLLERECDIADGRRKSELCSQAATVRLDLLGDLAGAARVLSPVVQNPALLLPALPTLWQVAVLQGDAPLIGRLVGLAKDVPFATSLTRRGVEILVLRLDDRDTADATTREAVRRSPADRTVRELRALLLSLLGRWQESLDALGGQGVDLAARMEACMILSERLERSEESGRLVRALINADDSRRYALERLIDRVPSGDWAELSALYQRKLDGLDAQGEGSRAERASTLFRLGQMLEALDDLEGAARRYAEATAETSNWGARLALHALRSVAHQRADWAQLAEVYVKLADGLDDDGLKAAYLYRAAELYEARLLDLGRAATVLEQALSMGIRDRVPALRLERIDLAHGRFAELEQLYQRLAEARPQEVSLWLARAALIREGQLEDPAGASEHLRQALAGSPADVILLWELQRLERVRCDLPRLLAAYQAEVQLTTDSSRKSHLLAAKGCIHLRLNQSLAARDAFIEALKLTPGDIICLQGLCWLHRNEQRFPELNEALRQLSAALRNPESRAGVLRDLGQTAEADMSDPGSALDAFEQLVALQPRNSQAVDKLAQLAAQAGKWNRVAELRERELAEGAAPPRALRLIYELGEVYLDRLGDTERARQAYEKILAQDPKAAPAVQALAKVYRRAKNLAKLRETLARELTITSAPARRLALSVELGRIAERTFKDDAAALAHYQTALAIDGGCIAALAGVERIYRTRGRLTELADMLGRAPKKLRLVPTLAALYEQLNRWQDLAALLAWEHSQLASPPEQAQSARGIAKLYEERLGNALEAARWFQRTLASSPTHDESLTSLIRLLETTSAWTELVDAIRRRLEFPTDTQKKLALLVRLAELCAERLNWTKDAISAYEQVLKIDRRHLGALRALAALYAGEQQTFELSRTLASLAEVVDATERPGIYAQIARLAEEQGDRDEALAAYNRALAIDPVHSAAFQGLANLLLGTERWRDLSELYERAITAAERGGQGPLPLAELHARRAELQFGKLAGAGEAAASYLRAMELDPSNEQVMQALEAVFARESDWRGLLSVYRRRGELLKDKDPVVRIETYRRAARLVQEQLQDTNETLSFLELILELDPTDEAVKTQLIGLYERRRDWDKLVNLYRAQVPLARSTQEQVNLLARVGRISEEGLRDLERAVAAYREMLGHDPSSLTALQALSRIYEATERWPELIGVTEKEIQLTTDRQQQALLYFRIGSVVEAKFSRIDDAVRWYTSALNASPACVPAVHGLRDIYIARGDWPMVIRSLEHEARLWQEKRERASVLAQIGEVYERRLGDIDQAISYYEGALAIDPRCVPATRALLDIYFDRQDWRQAAPLAKALNARALRDLPPADKAELFGKRAIVARQLSNFDEAFASLTIALEFDPFNANCLAELITCVKAGMSGHDRELDELIEHLKQAYTEKNEQPALGLLAWLRGVIVERRGTVGIGEVLEIFRQAVTLAPDHSGPSFALAEMLGRLRQWQEGAQILERFLARRPPRQDAVGAYLRLGDIWSEGAMDAPAAIAAYRKLLTIEPENREALYRISQDYYVSGRWADARMNMERLVAINDRTTPPVAPATLSRHVYYLGRILQEGFRAYDQAEARYRKAIELDGTFHTAYIALARSMMARGDRQNAIVFLTDAVRRVSERDGTPAAIPLQRGLANLLRRVGEPAQAEREYRKLISLNPSTDGVADRVTLAELYLQELSNEQAATQAAMAALEREPLYPPAFRLLISIYAKSAENDRVFALLSLLETTGDLEDVERTYLEDLRSRERLFTEPRGTLNDDLRARYMVTPQVLGAFTELWQSVREVFERPLLKQFEANPPPATDHFTRSATPPLRQLISSVLRICAVDADVYVKRDATFLARCDVGPKPIVFLGPAFASELNDGERRFILGKYLELIRLGAPLLMRMETAEAHATLDRVRELLSPDAERSPVAREIMRNLPRKNIKRVTEVVQMGAQSLIPGPAEWLEALERTSDRAGLITAGEVAPCLAAKIKLSGRALDPVGGGGRTLLAADGGIPLIHYQLSDDYFSLRRAIGAWR